MPPLSVLDTGITVADDGTPYPTAVIDVSGRPDVADLARVHAIEGIGDITTSLTFQGDAAVLTVSLTRPVTSEFAVAFPLPECRPVLEHAAETGNLLLATTSPSLDGDANPLWLAIDLDGARLVELLSNPNV